MVSSSIPDVLKLTKWKIRDGNVAFWLNNWADDGPLGDVYPVVENHNLKVKECKVEDGLDVNLLINLLGTEKAEEVLNTLSKARNGADRLVWKENTNEKFTSNCVWKCIRVRAPKLRWAEWIWHPCISKNISITMWKANNNVLSVDDKLKTGGILIVSKCDCCL